MRRGRYDGRLVGFAVATTVAVLVAGCTDGADPVAGQSEPSPAGCRQTSATAGSFAVGIPEQARLRTRTSTPIEPAPTSTREPLRLLSTRYATDGAAVGTMRISFAGNGTVYWRTSFVVTASGVAADALLAARVTLGGKSILQVDVSTDDVTAGRVGTATAVQRIPVSATGPVTQVTQVAIGDGAYQVFASTGPRMVTAVVREDVPTSELIVGVTADK